MPRIPRKDQFEENIVYHIFNRGNGKLDVFHDENDFRHFLKILKHYRDKFNLQIFHWVLMNNHFHLVASINILGHLSKCVGGITQAYAQYHHKRWNSAGKLWQNRFKSQPVQKEKYLYECGRYIERNPLRADIVKYPWDYAWSSCQVYVRNKFDGITTLDSVYDAFGEDQAEKIQGYKNWLMEGEDLSFNNTEQPMGDHDFIKRLMVKSGRMVVRKRGRPGKSGTIYS